MKKHPACGHYVEWDLTGENGPRCRCCHEDRGNEFFTNASYVGRKSIISFGKAWNEPSEWIDVEELHKTAAAQKAIEQVKQAESGEQQLHTINEIKGYRCKNYGVIHWFRPQNYYKGL